MVFEVINNPHYSPKMGFTKAQFRTLDDLYCRAVEKKMLSYRTVECDFEEGYASYTYYKSEYHAPLFRFMIRKIGPKTLQYEVYKQGVGLLIKSSLFDRAFEKLQGALETSLEI